MSRRVMPEQCHTLIESNFLSSNSTCRTKIEDACFLILRQLDIAFCSLDPKEQSECYILLFKKLPEKWKELYKTHRQMATYILLPFTENRVGDFIRNMSQMLITIRKYLRASEAVGATIVYSAATVVPPLTGIVLRSVLRLKIPLFYSCPRSKRQRIRLQ